MAAATTAAASSSSVSSSLSTTTSHALHRLLRPPPSPSPPPFSAFFCRPLSAACVNRKAQISRPTPLLYTFNLFSVVLPYSSSQSVLSSRSFSNSSLNFTPNALQPSLSLDELDDFDEDDDDDEDEDDEGIESDEDDELEENDAVSVAVSDESSSSSSSSSSSLKEELKKRDALKVPNLTVKEKKELASYAHGLGKKLKSQLVGKSGFTDNVATSFIETLEANELLKIKIHRTCPEELDDVVQRLQEATGSVVVSQIGRTVIIYRPSISKMKAEEKKNQARRFFVRKDSRFQPASTKGRVQRLTARSRQGSSRI